MRSTWRALPIIVQAVLTGLVVALTATLPWALLVSANLRHVTWLPWAALLMAPYLWLWWQYAAGRWRPASTSASRRDNARMKMPSDDVWGPALLAGIVGLVAVLLLQGILGRLVTLPQQQTGDISQYPRLTVLFSVVMSAIVAGVVEETSFRGYMQRPIEQRHGPVIAILVTGAVFGLAHFTHPEVTLVLLPYYMAVAAVYGTLAYLSDSVLPGMALHAGGNLFSAVGLFASGRSEWQPSATPRPLIWNTGPDAAFWGGLAALAAVTVVAILAYRATAAATRLAPPPPETEFL